MKKIRRLTGILIASLIGISTVLILLAAIKADKKSQAELAEIDRFIAQYEPETTQAEDFKPNKVITAEPVRADLVEVKTEEESNDGRGSNPDTAGSIGDNADPGTGRSDPVMDAEVTGTVEELAEYVLNEGLNGEERENYLSERYDEVQKYIDESYRQIKESYDYAAYEDYGCYDDSYAQVNYEPDHYYADGSSSYGSYGSSLTAESGVNYYNGVQETYYNLDMEPLVDLLYDLGYSGTYWIREDGVKMWDDYVIVAADYSYEPRGTIVETSLGTGMVLDTGEGGWAWHDIAVAW